MDIGTLPNNFILPIISMPIIIIILHLPPLPLPPFFPRPVANRISKFNGEQTNFLNNTKVPKTSKDL